MEELKVVTELFKSYYGLRDIAVSGVAYEVTEKHKQVSVSLVPRVEDMELDLKSLKSYYQRISVVTGFRLSSISKISFILNDNIDYRIQLKFLDV